MIGENDHEKLDDFLGDRLKEYKKWLDEGKISYSSKVIPVRESLDDRQWVLPTQQVLAIIKDADVIALADCVCRGHYKRCQNPVDVCLLLNDYGENVVSKDRARKISYEEAASRLKAASDSGLVHLSLYRPDHRLYALCSCCSCCCHDLQLLLSHGQDHLVAHSDYVASTNEGMCDHCGECVSRCAPGARELRDEEMVCNADACFGCGLCVAACPMGAISMVLKKEDAENRIRPENGKG